MTEAVQRRSAPFSTHARGVPLFDKARFADVPQHASRALIHLRDMSSSTFWFLSMQTWSSFWSVIVSMVSVIFFTYYDSEYKLAVPLDWGIIGFTIILPMVGFLWFAYHRREQCLKDCSLSKTLMLQILNASVLWTSGGRSHNNNEVPVGDHHQSVVGKEDNVESICQALNEICRAMHDYFMPARFYARSYPYFGYKTAMIQIALDRSRHLSEIKNALQQLTLAVVALRSDGLPTALEAQLHDRVFNLQLAIDRMSNVKEYRTPQGIRSLCRSYVLLLAPLFYGVYWSFVAQQTNFALAFFLAIIWQIALCGVLNVYIDLEDPFDNYGLDGIFIDEHLYEVEQALGALGYTDALNTVQAEAVITNANGGPRLPSAFDYDAGSAPQVVRVETDNV